jgi:hypothetical protein
MKRSFVPLFAVAITLILSSSCGDDAVGDSDAGRDAGGSHASCGNGKVEGDELCDGSDLNKETCKTLGDGLYTGGKLSCTKKCVFDVAMCIGNDSGLDDLDDGGGNGGGAGAGG